MATIRELELGVWLDDAVVVDADVRRAVESLAHLLANCVADLVVCLSLFEQARAAGHSRFDSGSREDWERDMERQRQREAELEAEHGLVAGQRDWWERSEAIREQARWDVLRQRWAETGGPEAYRDRLVFIHARSFVTSLAVLQRSLLELCEYDLPPDVSDKIRAACDDFPSAFPGLKDVRNSAAHVEDRVRGEVRGRKIVTQPITNGMIHAPGGGVLVVESLFNNRYGGTIADGTHADVEVSDQATEVARQAVQAVFDALPWRPGHRTREPSR